MERDREYLLDILGAAKLALAYVAEKRLSDFLADTQCQDAVVRRLEIIGEAAGRVSDGTRAEHPSLPWKAMVGMRNVMIHRYDEVDFSIVWDTVRDQLPPVVETLSRVVPPDDGA